MSKASTVAAPVPAEKRYTSVRQLVEHGREKGYLLVDEVMEGLPDDVVAQQEDLEEIFDRFVELEIGVIQRPERNCNRSDVEEPTEVFEKKDAGTE